MAKGKSPPEDKLEQEIEGAMARLQSPSGAKAGVVQLIHREGDSAPPILVYDTAKGAKIELRFDGAEPWVTQAQMAAMFGVDVRTVSDHIQKYVADGEFDESVIRKFRITAADGKSYETNHYGLDVAFYVGYRVNSARGALFRRWATDILVRFAKHGYAMDVERLKAPDDPSVVDELKEIIRDIRGSTQNVYREVRRIVSLCQDYDGKSETAHAFYARMENKLLYVATSMTAPELIIERADADKPDMGLTFYTGKRGPTQADARVANNYLAEGEARVKNRATVMLLDYFEEQVDQGRLVAMVEAEEKLDGFIRFNNWPLLRGAGRVSRSDADEYALTQQKLLKAQ
jgi:hypothetical protein